MLTIGITGHRSLAEPGKVSDAIALCFEELRQRDPNLEAISAVAEGADCLFAIEAIRSGMPLHVVLPFDQMEYEKDFSPDGLVVLRQVISQSISIKTLPADPIHARDEAYKAVGVYITDRSDVLMAVWDGKPASGLGGTADIVAYAKMRSKEIHIIESKRM